MLGARHAIRKGSLSSVTDLPRESFTVKAYDEAILKKNKIKEEITRIFISFRGSRKIFGSFICFSLPI
jgi:hypothetical protein